MSEEKNRNQEVVDQETIDNLTELYPEVEVKHEEMPRINDTLDFNILSLSGTADSLTEKLNKSETVIQTILDKMQLSLDSLEDIVSKIDKESRVLSLIPQRTQDRIDKIAPQIATEVGIIHHTKTTEINNQFYALQDKLTHNFDECRQSLEGTTSHCIKQLTNTIDHIILTIEQKLTQYSNQLAKEADAVGSKKSVRFLKNLAFIILFSGLVSAFSSYLVATQFPRYVSVDTTGNLSIIDSKVQVWGAKISDKKENDVKASKK